MVSRIEMTEVFKYIIHIWEMFSVLSRAWDKEKIRSPSDDDSSWGLNFFVLSHARDRTKNIFLYFFTELKTNHLAYSIIHTYFTEDFIKVTRKKNTLTASFSTRAIIEPLNRAQAVRGRWVTCG